MNKSNSDLIETFEFMKKQEYNNIPGVIKVSSKNGEGLSVAVTAMTHGNEPSGLAAIHYFLRNNLLQDLLNQGPGGSVYFVLNNIEAAEKYFSLPADATAQQREECRFIDHNMNRLPDDILECAADDTRTEIARTLELYPLIQTFDAGIDIHSMRTSNFQMIMEVKGNGLHHAKNFPINTIITNMIPTQIGVPISALYGGSKNEDATVVGIEAGEHEATDSCQYAIECTRAFLASLGVIPPQTIKKRSHDLKEYKIAKGIIPKIKGSQMIRQFETFEAIQPSTPLVSDPVSVITRAGIEGHILLAQPPGHDLKITEECCFVSEPVKNYHVA